MHAYEHKYPYGLYLSLDHVATTVSHLSHKREDVDCPLSTYTLQLRMKCDECAGSAHARTAMNDDGPSVLMISS